MKFKVLVVAAMVITSVNAGGRGGFKESETARKDRICSNIFLELGSLQEKVEEVYSVLFRQIPDSYKQETGPYSSKSHSLKDWLKQCYEDNRELLQPIKEKLVVLDEKYRSVWAELKIEDCSIESRPYLKSPEEMAKRGYFSKWYD
ncbi:hypothetical protein BASA50_011146 [Batrachochytrium salamandrivorans]|uniref:Uncharacterized protein n=1 Tax=Batrachochytrium salamandrivorans TaxID=1357716 RepID=A0ABQ8EWJ8_9FUNG|nr:hypothetical protein BASA62_004520 [Batrachochytrium salamandrivorans]KAH6582613.1 hypothetical protein BASA60_001858 [Batrachochytrium salamandrivorans]KAH6587755.1 hypothetical protein BASA50_011146 [Batrachochytrium salamandrivorans]